MGELHINREGGELLYIGICALRYTIFMGSIKYNHLLVNNYQSLIVVGGCIIIIIIFNDPSYFAYPSYSLYEEKYNSGLWVLIIM